MESNRSRRLFSVLGLVFAVLLLSGVVFADRTTYITDASRLKISMISQDPDPVGPGDLLEVRWKVENLGSDNAQNVQLMLNPEYPFSLLPGDDGSRDIGSIQGQQVDDEGVIVLYKLRVDEYAIEGDNTLKLEYKFDFNDWIKTDDVYIVRVQTRDVGISVESVETTPEKLEPGSTGKLNIKIKNLADSYMKDVTFKVDLTFSQYLQYAATITDTSIYVNALPFAPLNSTTEKRIESIAPGKSAVFSYDLMTYPDAEAKVYKVPVIITFYDELGTEYTKNDVIGLVVGSEPELEAVIDSTTAQTPGTAGEVSIKFVNKGITDIKFLNVELKENGVYKITSSTTDYVGNVDSDDYENAEFKLFLKDTATDPVKIPVHITYKDSNNNEYAKDINLELKLLTPEERGEQKSSKLGLIIFVFVILVVGWILYKRWEKKKKDKGK